MAHKIRDGLVWPDARGWIGLGVFALTAGVLAMIAFFPDLRKDDFFQSIAILIVGTGFVNGVVSWAYSATKGGGEQADANAAVATKLAENATLPKNDVPQDVRIVSPDPIPVTSEAATEELPLEAPPYEGPDMNDVPAPSEDTPEEPKWRS